MFPISGQARMVEQTCEEMVVILDDDPLIHRHIQRALNLQIEGFTRIDELRSRMSELEPPSPSAVWLDIKLGRDANGLDLVPEIRAFWPRAPIIVITSNTRGEAVSEALSSGASDFIRKPLNTVELRARYQVRVREMRKRYVETSVAIGDINLNRRLRLLNGPRGDVHIAPIVANLLECLMERPNEVIPRDTLKRRGWGAVKVSSSAFDRKLHELRAALNEVSDGFTLKSIYGRGVFLATDHGNGTGDSFGDR